MPGPELQQHDLRPAAADRFLAAVGPPPGATVLEVGAGTGVLTAALLAAGATVHAVEIDAARLALLRERHAADLAAGRLVLHAGDARILAPPLPPGWRVVANPPFRLGAILLKRWLLTELPGGPPARIDLVLQVEAAARFSPPPGAWTRLGVLGELWGESGETLSLHRDDVDPPSKVDLCTWRLERRDWARSPAELTLVDRLLDLAFAGAPTVRRALRGVATKAMLDRQAGTHRWDPDGPARAVPPKAWLALARYLDEVGRL